METTQYKSRRGWLIAAGVIEILIGCCFGLFALASWLVSLPAAATASPAQGTPLSPNGARIIGIVFYGVAAQYFFAVGLGSILRKNWARILMLIVSSCWLLGGVISTAAVVMMFPMIAEQAKIAPETRSVVLTATIILMSVLGVVVPAVFLVIYSLPSVRATCRSDGTALAAQLPAEAAGSPKTPVPVVILAVWQGIGTLAVLSCFWKPAALVFGFVLHGPVAFLLLSVSSLIAGCAAWLLYRRRLAGWATTLAYVLFWSTSSFVTFAQHDIAELWRKMGLSERQLALLSQFSFTRTILLLSTVAGVAPHLILIWYTKRFFVREAGSE